MCILSSVLTYFKKITRRKVYHVIIGIPM